MLREQFIIRKLELKDLTVEYFTLLQNLSIISLGDISEEKNLKFFNKLDEEHQIWLVEDSVTQKIIGTGTILVENKLIRNYGRVGHLEDIVILPDYQSKGLGKMLVEHLCKIVEDLGCYKCVLNCDPELVSFYQKNNFTNNGINMRVNFL